MKTETVTYSNELPPNGKSLKQLYFILWTMGENFPSRKSFSNADLQRHEHYMRQAYHDGRLLMAALFEYEIHKFVRNNPDVADKRIQARIKPCKPVYWKNFE